MRIAGVKAKEPLSVAPIKRLRTQGARPDPSPVGQAAGAPAAGGAEPDVRARPTVEVEVPASEERLTAEAEASSAGALPNTGAGPEPAAGACSEVAATAMTEVAAPAAGAPVLPSTASGGPLAGAMVVGNPFSSAAGQGEVVAGRSTAAPGSSEGGPHVSGARPEAGGDPSVGVAINGHLPGWIGILQGAACLEAVANHLRVQVAAGRSTIKGLEDKLASAKSQEAAAIAAARIAEGKLSDSIALRK